MDFLCSRFYSSSIKRGLFSSSSSFSHGLDMRSEQEEEEEEAKWISHTQSSLGRREAGGGQKIAQKCAKSALKIARISRARAWPLATLLPTRSPLPITSSPLLIASSSSSLDEKKMRRKNLLLRISLSPSLSLPVSITS